MEHDEVYFIMPDKGGKQGWGCKKRKKWSGMQILPFIYPQLLYENEKGSGTVYFDTT